MSTTTVAAPTACGEDLFPRVMPADWSPPADAAVYLFLLSCQGDPVAALDDLQWEDESYRAVVADSLHQWMKYQNTGD